MKPFQRPPRYAGFTLVEIMVVVAIIGLLLLMALPAFRKARMSSQNTRFLSDTRGFRAGIESYTLAEGQYPPESAAGALPAGLDDYIKVSDFSQTTSIGGSWKIETGAVALAVGAFGHTATNEQLQLMDDNYDDGNLGSGQLRTIAGGYFLILEP